MGRRYQLLLAVVVASFLTAGVAQAGIPDPALSDVPNVLVVPGGALEYIVTVNGSEGPIDTALVELVFSTEVNGILAWCVGQTTGTISALTDANGEASFFIAAGGCVDAALVSSPPAVRVFAKGIELAQVGVVSPDAVDGDGVPPTGGWNITTGSLAEVGLSDASVHTPPVKDGTYSYCTDFNSDGAVDLSDASIMTPSIKDGSNCTAQ
mgnify:CR=1 FL=1